MGKLLADSAAAAAVEDTRRRVVGSGGLHTQFQEEVVVAASSVAEASRRGWVTIQAGVIRTINQEASVVEAVAVKRKRYPAVSVVKVGVWVPAVRMPSRAPMPVEVMCR
jgi:hypothetical protein